MKINIVLNGETPEFREWIKQEIEKTYHAHEVEILADVPCAEYAENSVFLEYTEAEEIEFEAEEGGKITAQEVENLYDGEVENFINRISKRKIFE